MAFFGLTALGPQNTLGSAAKHFRNLQIFTESDFQNAWERVNGRGALHCRIAKLDDMMKVLFCGPPPPNDITHIDRAFLDAMASSDTPETISFTKYMNIMNKLRDEAAIEEKSLEGRRKPTCEFYSSVDMKESSRRHQRMKQDLQIKQTAPLTSSQEYGWAEQRLQPPTAGRSGSEITAYAAELIKNGIYF